MGGVSTLQLRDLMQTTSSAAPAAPLIALVGSDGSGKSTVGEALLGWMREQRPTELCHLGKQTGNIGRAIARWPIVGKSFDTKIAAKADKAKDPRGPSLLTGIAIYLFSMRRVRRFKRMLAVRARGTAILTDRFPQNEIPGPMDGLGLANAQGSVLRWLARRERAHYDWMVAHRPDLVLRLTVDFDTAFARKPDHRPSSLKAKIADLAGLKFGGAPVVDIDATRPLDEVLASAKLAITAALAGRAA
jgi:thymidylate kinase